MRKIILLLVIVLNAPMLFAQSAHFNNSVLYKHNPMIGALLQHQTNSKKKVCKTTSGVPRLRVIAQSTRDSLSSIADSVNVSYSLYRGSTYDYNTMIYPYNYVYNTTPMFDFAGIFTKPQVLADTYLHWTINPYTLAYGLYEKNYSVYDSSDNQKSFSDVFIDSVTNQNTGNVNAFNTANNIKACTQFISVSGVMDSSFKQFFTYDSTNKLIEDSVYEYHLGGWHLVGKSFYAYDSLSNLIKIDFYGQVDTTFDSVLIEREQYINTYDSLHRLLTVATSLYTGAVLDTSTLDTFGYTGSFEFHTSWKDYQYDNINHYWAPMFYMFKTLNIGGLPDTININGFDSILNSWVPQTFQIAHYDTANNPDTLIQFDYNFSYFPSTPTFTTVYYYELYNDLTRVNKEIPENQKIVVYPNPSENLVQISISDVLNSKQITISLINSSGQPVLKQIAPVRNNIADFSIKEQVPGVYWLIVQDQNGKVISKQTIVKTSAR